MNTNIISFNEIIDTRGSLIALEAFANIPFSIKRVYYMYNVQLNVMRGEHAHKELQQVLICVAGSCTVRVTDGVDCLEFKLSRPDQGLYMDRMLWHDMRYFSTETVLLVLASDHYNESDYIRDYDLFMKFSKTKIGE